MLLIRGALAILFGLIAFIVPGLTVLFLTYLFAAYALGDGIFALIAGLHWKLWMLSLLGVVGILAGLLTFFYPAVTAITLLFFIAAWAIIRGAAEIATAVQLRKVIPNEWALILGGSLSVLFGVLLFANPTVGALSVIWIIGVYALIFGVLLVITAFRLKNHPWTATQLP